MFGTDDIFSWSVNPDHRTVSKIAKELVCNTHQWAMEPLQLKVRSSKLLLASMAACPSPRSTLQQPSSRPVATQLGSSQRSHAPPCSLGCDQMSPTPGPTAVPCQAQPSRQPVATRSGRVVRPSQNTLTLDLVLTHKHAHIHSHSQT